ncbi:hypothetical protein [uncultured Corynebacterium sp.]|uniref:hypothetical protein n=1 Tax=Corynebacterium variabile TaxID=1727 RepID=UPI002597A998|nr:hypothetical protein [uncultured Corynebacterium sp.]
MTSDRDYLAGEIRRRAARLFANSDREHETCSYQAADILLYRGILTVPSFPSDRLDEVDRVIWECTSFPDDSDWSDDEDNYVEWSEGDIVDGPAGLGIVLPAGEVWHLSDEKALSLMRGLSTMICYRLTQPWSADDDSTILSRGTRPVLREA